MHIAIIMDGNGRWASRRRLPRSAGHRAGAKTVNAIVESAARRGIGTLSLYAFSAANWQRPKAEVSALFALLRRYLLSQTQRCLEQSIRINVIGRRDRLNTTLRDLIEQSEAVTAHCSGMLLRIAVDYSAQHSLMAACRRLQAHEPVDRALFGAELGAVDHSVVAAPDVDLMIRTGGEQRLSDFLLWECAYAELSFVPTLWPDFDDKAFEQCLEDFAARDRRFGRISSEDAKRSSHG
jgi:undecaprenyl diphosphate synthase